MVVPLLKKTLLNSTKPQNYQPILLLPFFTKVAEKYVNQQLSTFIEAINLLHRTQSGFRPSYSTEYALLLASESIRQILDRGDTAALLMLDLSAALDIVYHNLLIERLWSCGIAPFRCSKNPSICRSSHYSSECLRAHP